MFKQKLLKHFSSPPLTWFTFWGTNAGHIVRGWSQTLKYTVIKITVLFCFLSNLSGSVLKTLRLHHMYSISPSNSGDCFTVVYFRDVFTAIHQRFHLQITFLWLSAWGQCYSISWIAMMKDYISCPGSMEPRKYRLDMKPACSVPTYKVPFKILFTTKYRAAQWDLL